MTDTGSVGIGLTGAGSEYTGSAGTVSADTGLAAAGTADARAAGMDGSTDADTMAAARSGYAAVPDSPASPNAGDNTDGDDETSLKAAASAVAARIMHNPATDAERAIVERQLGRFPRGMVAVGARCVCGRPLAVVTRPLLPGGIPFPTTCYLTSPEAVKAVSHAEANGVMKIFTAMLADDEGLAGEYVRAHRLYLAFRHEFAMALNDSEEHISSTSAGGMPTRVKCLHALLAQTLIMGRGSNPIGDLTAERIRDEFDPNVCRCSVQW